MTSLQHNYYMISCSTSISTKMRFGTLIVGLCANILLILDSAAGSAGCALRKYSPDSIVCVCNSTYCDTLTGELPKKGNVLTLTSSKDGLRFQRNVWATEKLVKSRRYVHHSYSVRYQTLKGFGGALTDAAALNAMNLSRKARDNFFKSYFGSSGIEYNIIRVPIGSCDFSTHTYTYLDTPNDFNLSTFSLAPEDLKLKIPILKEINAISNKNISLYASPWTAPAWMKTNDRVTGWGRLKGLPGDEYHKTWAKYFVHFFDMYKVEGIRFWGVTMQNEPSNGLLTPAKWQSMGWLPDAQRDFIKKDLGPALVEGGYRELKLMIHDDQRLFLPGWPKKILSDSAASNYVSGIAVHWYWDWLVCPEVLNKTHELFPDKFILATEACNKDAPTKSFGSWEMGEKYSNDILDNLNNWAVGWADWNMCLNFQGGPNWVNNFDNSPIIVNSTSDEFYKQPMYYHLGHFSKFHVEGSVRVSSTSNVGDKLKFTAMQRPDGYIVVVILNEQNEDMAFQINVGSYPSETLGSTISKRSIQTYVWKP